MPQVASTVMHFFAQLSNSKLEMSIRVRNEYVLFVLKQVNDAKKETHPMIKLLWHIPCGCGILPYKGRRK
jgi:hypothetical protein